MTDRIAFNTSAKKPQGHHQPKGVIVAWNDLADLVFLQWHDISPVNYNNKEYEDMPPIAAKTYDAFKIRKFSEQYATALNQGFVMFSDRVREMIKQGQMGLFCRDGINAGYDDMPKLLYSTSNHPHLLSVAELREQLEVLKFLDRKDQKHTKAFSKIADFLDRAERELVDYADVGITAVNSPINKARLKNSVYQKMAEHKRKQQQSAEASREALLNILGFRQAPERTR